MKYIFILFILASTSASAQRLKKSDKQVIENLKKEITYLASDQLQGRRTGTEGEKLAYEYLSKEFKKAGLAPKGDGDSYIQSFEIDEGKQILPATHLIINDTALETGKDFFPLIFSANGSVKGDVSPAFKENGRPWFWDIKDVLEENKNNPHFDVNEAIKNKALNIAQERCNGPDNLQFRKPGRWVGI